MRAALRVLRQCYRCCLGALCLLSAVSSLLYFYHSTKPPPVSPRPWYTRPCALSDSALDDLARLTFSMHDVLHALHVPHALCYGTLWGTLRQGRVLPWDNNVDFCTMDVHLVNVTTAQLQDAFLEKGILFNYDWTTGSYRAHFNRGVDVDGNLHLFTKSRTLDDDEVAVPGGWARAVWRWFGQRQLSFPALLLEAPFSEDSFHGRQMPVPHEGIELLKYLYPENWWRVVKPPGCV